MNPTMRQIRASAGSGKTYELTTSFLRLLAGAGDPPEQSGCRLAWNAGEGAGPEGKGGAWTEIMAVTFTNSAAAEMRDRIISRLKDMALKPDSISDDLAKVGWTQALALQRVQSILRRLGSLNVSTIDSLLHRVVRLSALDLALPPDFKSVFDTRKALEPLMDRLMARARPADGESGSEDASLAAMLDEACHGICHHTSFTGFLAGTLLRRRILQILPFVSSQGEDLAAPDEAKARLYGIYAAVCEKTSALRGMLEGKKLALARYFPEALKSVADWEKRGCRGKTPDSKMLRQDCLDDCLRKESKGKAGAEAEAAFLELRAAVARLDSEAPLLAGALSVLPYVPLARALKREVPQFLSESGSVPADGIPDFAAYLLGSGQGVSEALCRLGAGLNHVLMDEFQDTSRKQWVALVPLAAEALSRGGSFTWVGDVKQAIYGWRGGDATLFDKVLHDDRLLSLCPGRPEEDRLQRNWRSSRNIVESNNSIFSVLADQKKAESIIDAMLPKPPKSKPNPAKDVPEEVRRLIQQEQGGILQQSFARSEQEVNASGQGLVVLRRLEDDEDIVRGELVKLVREIKERRPWGDICVLVRYNDEAELAARWMTEEGIPVVTENSFLLDAHHLVSQLLTLLGFLDNPEDDAAFLALLCGPLFADLLRRNGLEAEACQNWLVQRSDRIPLSAAFRKDFPAAWKSCFEGFYASSGLLTPYDVVREAVARLDLDRRFPDDTVFVRRFLEILYSAENQDFASLPAFLEEWKRTGQSEKAPMPEHLDAVRVMTIHKAKGLEFPVVILPWHNFRIEMKPDEKFSKLRQVEVGELNLLVPLGSALKEEYCRALACNGREALHMLYVAWTRPQEELYAFLPPEKPARSEAFNRVLNSLLEGIPFENGVYTLGQSPEKRPDDLPDLSQGGEVSETGEVREPDSGLPAEGDSETWQPMAWLPRLRISRGPLPDFALRGRRRGLFMHHCLACLRVPAHSGVPDEETALDMARHAVDCGLRTFPLPLSISDADRQEIIRRLAWYGSRPETERWIRHGVPEYALVDEKGALYRMDLLVDDGESLTVIEYKTGHPEPAHERQILGYMRLLVRSRAPKRQERSRPVHGALVYVDRQQIIPVELP